MFGFFIFNFIRKVTSEKTAVQVVNFLIRHMPPQKLRNRVTCWMMNVGSDWVFMRTSYKECRECFLFVIDKALSDIHPACYQELLEQEEKEEEKEWLAAYKKWRSVNPSSW